MSRDDICSTDDIELRSVFEAGRFFGQAEMRERAAEVADNIRHWGGGGAQAAAKAIRALALPEQPQEDRFDLETFIAEQIEFSRRTFGEGRRTKGVTQHIAKELEEIRSDPSDTAEWIDVILLALDGAWRHGWTPRQITDGMTAKLAKNKARKWGPDLGEGHAIEHDRSEPPR